MPLSSLGRNLSPASIIAFIRPSPAFLWIFLSFKYKYRIFSLMKMRRAPLRNLAFVAGRLPSSLARSSRRLRMILPHALMKCGGATVAPPAPMREGRACCVDALYGINEVSASILRRIMKYAAPISLKCPQLMPSNRPGTSHHVASRLILAWCFLLKWM